MGQHVTRAFVPASTRHRPRISGYKLNAWRKSAPIIGDGMSATINVQDIGCLKPRFRERQRLPYVGIRERFTACKECVDNDVCRSE